MIAHKTILNVDEFMLHTDVLLKTSASREELLAQLWIK